MFPGGKSSASTSGDLGYESNADGSMVFMDDLQQGPFNDKAEVDRKLKDSMTATGDPDCNLLKMFCKHTSAHGFKCAMSVERSRAFRCLWTLATVVAAGALAGALIELWCNYHCYPVKTLIDLKYSSQLPFPAVTLCNLQSFNCSKADLLPNVTNGGRKLCDIISMNSLTTQLDPGDVFSDPEYQDIMKMPASELYRAASVKINETLLFCSWNNQRTPCEDIFKQTYGLEGSCFQFNHNATDPIFTSSIGPITGLSVLATQPLYTENAAATGLKVLLHNPGTFPDVLTQGFLIPPGFTTFGRLNVRQTSHLPYPYKSFGDSYCIDYQPSDNGAVYNRESCISTCVYNMTIHKCNCSIRLDDWPVSNVLRCTFRQLLLCMHPTFVHLHREAAMSSDVCSHCKYSCRTTRYSLSTSQASLPILDTLDTVLGVGGKERTSRSRVRYLELRLFYDQMTKEEIRNEPEYTWHSMLGIVGGQMGFFIGASVLTILELLECLCCLLSQMCMKTFRRLWPQDVRHEQSSKVY